MAGYYARARPRFRYEMETDAHDGTPPPRAWWEARLREWRANVDEWRTNSARTPSVDSSVQADDSEGPFPFD